MEDNLEGKIKGMLEQCNAYLVVLPNSNAEALAIVDQFKTQLTSILNDLELSKSPRGDNPLTAREEQVLGLVAQGHPNKEIAYQLSISPKTVQFHLKSLFNKLEVGSRTEAVTVALKLGLLTL